MRMRKGGPPHASRLPQRDSSLQYVIARFYHGDSGIQHILASRYAVKLLLIGSLGGRIIDKINEAEDKKTSTSNLK